MRIESTSSAIEAIQTQPIKNDRMVNRNMTAEQNLSFDGKTFDEAQKRNFKTIDPQSGELTTIGEKKLIEAIEKANKTLQGANTSFEFTIHEQTREIMVKVINKETDEIIREIPPEKILDLVAKMWELAGILVDERI